MPSSPTTGLHHSCESFMITEQVLDELQSSHPTKPLTAWKNQWLKKE